MERSKETLEEQREKDCEWDLLQNNETQFLARICQMYLHHISNEVQEGWQSSASHVSLCLNI